MTARLQIQARYQYQHGHKSEGFRDCLLIFPTSNTTISMVFIRALVATYGQEESGMTQRDMLDMGSRIHEMRLLRLYRELQCQDREFTVKSDRSRQRAISDLLETDRRRREEMRELRAADRARQQQIIQTLTVMQTLQREMIPLQGLVTTLQGQVTALQGQCLAATDATMNGVDKPYFGTVSGDPNSVARDCICNDLVDLRKKMTDKYCPRNEMKKLEAEYCWNMKVKVILMWSSTKPTFPRISTAGCGFRMYPEETYKIERYVGGLPDMIHGNIVASKPKTMQEAVEMATELMDKEVMYLLLKDKLKTKNFENTSRNIRLQHRIRGKTPAWQTILLDRG
ncbi:hypothetical protein Tco_0179615 [Tanacetum coccineum]